MNTVDSAFDLAHEAPASRWRLPNPLLILCVAVGAWLVLVPVAALLLTAFTEDTGLGFGAFTLDNFIEAYSSARILRLFGNSLIYAAGTAAVTFVIGGFVAWAVERTDTPGGVLFHNLALLSFAIPGLLMAMAWIFVLSPNIGWVNAVLKSTFGLASAPPVRQQRAAPLEAGGARDDCRPRDCIVPYDAASCRRCVKDLRAPGSPQIRPLNAIYRGKW